MKSSRASASARRAPFGVESTGLPATVTSARIWPSPGVSISSSSVTTGSSPLNFRIVAHARMPTSLVNVAGLAARQHVVRRSRPHCAAGFVEIAGDGIKHVDQPLTESAEGLCREADAPVGDRARGGAKCARQRTQRFCRDAGVRGDALGRKSRSDVAQSREAVVSIGESSQTFAALFEDDVE